MLNERILSTLEFFNIQELPLTLMEIHRFLLMDKNSVRAKMDASFELVDVAPANSSVSVNLDTVLASLESLMESGVVETSKGFYFLPGSANLVNLRLVNYLNGLRREKLLQRYMFLVKFVPFVRGVALGGSQALGQQRATSDIDLLVISHPDFMWLCRTFMMIYFQIFGIRRDGKKIANRFCLNHFIANIREVDAERNLYKAMEYTRLRPIIFAENIIQFQQSNLNWINQFMPNFRTEPIKPNSQPKLQKFFEMFFLNKFGLWIESRLKAWQSARIKEDQFVFIRSDELSFHPESKHTALLQKFFSS